MALACSEFRRQAKLAFWTMSVANTPNQPARSEANAAFLDLARHGRLPQLRHILTALDATERRERLRAEDEHGNTALLLAIIYEYPNVASLLLQFEEIDAAQTNKRGHTALSLAAWSRRPFVVSAVLHRLLCVEGLDRGELITFPMLAQMLSTDGSTTVSLGLARRNLIDFYAQLDGDALALCVVRAFKRLPGTCLYECVQLAAAVQLRSQAVRGYDTYRSDDLEATSARLQLSAAGCLVALGRLQDGLGRYEVEQLLQSPLGEAAIKLAIRQRCKHFLSQPPVQALLTSEWHGPLLHSILDHDHHHGSFSCHLGHGLVYLLVLTLNLLLLPFITACPLLENLLIGHLKRDAAEKLLENQLPERKTRGHGVRAAAVPNGVDAAANGVDAAATGVGAAATGVDAAATGVGAAANGVGAAANRAPSPPTTASGGRRRRMSWPAFSPPDKLAPTAPSSTVPVDSTAFEEDKDALLAQRPPLLHYYLLRVPLLKFVLRLASDIALAVCATFDEGEPSVWIFLVWPLGGMLSEYTQLVAADESTPTLFASLKNEVLSWMRADIPSTYRADLFNTVDMISLHLLLASEITYYSAPAAHLPLRAFAVLALYVRLLRLIYIHPTFGPLVLLLVRMTIDMVKLFVLLIFVVVALVSALYVVEPSWTGSDALDRAPRSPACDDFYIFRGSWNNWAKLAFVVLNAVVDGRAQDALFMCVLHEDNENRYLLWTFTYLLLLFVVVLLLNMLIAMFSRSFDLMYDSMTIHVQSAFARAVVAWCASSPEPPPLNLLEIPYRLVCLFLSVLPSKRYCACRKNRASCCCNKATLPEAANADISLTVVTATSATIASSTAAAAATAATSYAATSAAAPAPSPASPDVSFRAGRRLEGGLSRLLRSTHGTFSGLGLQPAVEWLLQGETEAGGPSGGGEGLRDYEGTTVKSVTGVRNSWEIWKEKTSEEELAHQVADFIAKREDTLAQEERWRNKMMRRLGDKFDHVDTRLDRMSERFEQLANACTEIRESVASLQSQQQ